MRKFFLIALVALTAAACWAQQESEVTIDGKDIVMRYGPPAAKNRASATLNTEGNLAFKGFNAPLGAYTVYILADGAQWQLAVMKGAKAAYDAKSALGQVPMTMGKAPAASPDCKITISKTAALAGKIDVLWNGVAATATFLLDRGPNDKEW